MSGMKLALWLIKAAFVPMVIGGATIVLAGLDWLPWPAAWIGLGIMQMGFVLAWASVWRAGRAMRGRR